MQNQFAYEKECFGYLEAIALVCDSASHFDRLEKLLIDNTVQQLSELTSLANGNWY